MMTEATPEYAVLTQLQLMSIEQATGVQLQRDLLDRLGTRVVRALLHLCAAQRVAHVAP